MTAATDFVFLNLTCNSEEQEYEHIEQPSTHDYAEFMLYAFVDNTPCVADLLFSKQQLQQGEFLKLTADNGQDWSLYTNQQEISTHEPGL